MKLSKLFHTLYATVMALPVLIIPIFALNILHKETEPISIEVQEKISVDFNQQIQNGNFVDNNDWYVYNGTLSNNNNEGIVTPNNSGSYIYQAQRFTPIYNHYYYYRAFVRLDNVNQRIRLRVFGSWDLFVTNTLETTKLENRVLWTSNLQNLLFVFSDMTSNSTAPYYIQDVVLFDLTQMFGSGNEPTIEEFNNMFNGTYYDYTLSQKMLVNKPTTTTFNSTDIGSQFVYALYKPVHDYFNFGDFFGLGGMYDWFQLNIFNGTAPLSFFIVFNVMIYWLFISLFWLLFDILIYVPMVIHKWLDKAEM